MSDGIFNGNIINFSCYSEYHC